MERQLGIGGHNNDQFIREQISLLLFIYELLINKCLYMLRGCRDEQISWGPLFNLLLQSS